MAVVDNCCHVRNAIQREFPEISVVLDVWHFMMRYLICISGGTKNPKRAEVARDIVDAILKTTADKYNLAVYWSQEEQETRLIGAYEKWVRIGGVWTAAAEKTHADQLEHVRKGCLVRIRQDIPSDGSRIEGSHKGWNGLQRAFASGLEVMTALCHDFVLRRNVRITGNMDASTTPTCSFVKSTSGSHHIRLVDEIARFWNTLICLDNCKNTLNFQPLPQLPHVHSNEKFGLTISKSAASYHNLVEIKEEPLDDLLDLSSQDELDAETILRDINIDPTLLHHPLRVLVPQAHVRPGAHATGVVTAMSTSPMLPPDPHSSPPPSPLTSNGLSNASLALKDTIATSDQAAINQVSPEPSAARFVAASAGASNSEPINCDSESCGSHKTGCSESGVLSLEGVQSAGAPIRSSTTSASSTTETFNVTQALSVTKRKVSSGTRENSGKRARLSTVETESTNASTTITESHLISSSHTKKLRPLHSFFAMHKHHAAPGSHCDSAVQQLPSIQSSPADPNLLPVDTVNISGLTRSQQLFSISTGIDVRATSIGSGDEFFLFMDLRLKNRWISFLMTPRKWVTAADEYNVELAKCDKSKGRSTIGKTPRALMDKLSEIEPRVLGHVTSGNYASHESGDEAFWKKHCVLVPLVKPEDGGDRKRKTHTCTRCKMVMYPGPERSAANHKKSYCADGVRQKPKVVERTVNDVVHKVVEELPEYPQPVGLFTHGTHFHPKIFLAYVLDLYTRLVARNGSGSEKAMEDAAFTALLTKRLRVFPEEGLALFELFPSMKLGPVSADLVVERGGVKYLRVDYLSDTRDGESDGESPSDG
ncbi:hypothetical protein A0H81_11830 [Grifola frondosa]|uniref:Uncharacterized protein n=1 Tax=Grifola frondosa TaxID=5627 RepID=A0A1C7LU92_GRIFR|nr:hypothetical protein A0H81_11830 [Grifola frondosa]